MAGADECGFVEGGGAVGDVDRPAKSSHLLKMRLPGYPCIAINAAMCGWRPIIAGTRVRITDVLEMLAGDARRAEILEDFSYLIKADVLAALAYSVLTVGHGDPLCV